ncbi:winged helix-turn-helix transcriptional regulator [Amycolatopsis jejuensis]|uniref:winged helix-turn-helix transcriptional regulator n=1 Tax=Amycolatopsis jejuensis TaxID=330084 RepID=UPI000A07167A|nr:helix-turn-helix domain-containing protein [Amycolatopsis jejuensis]
MSSPFLADCPARLAVELIADKWTVVVLAGLSRGPVRHGELVDLIGGISRKVLTQTLRRLEAHGLVRRRAYPEVPPRVEYELTPLGATLTEPIRVLTDWANTNGDAVLEALDTGRRTEPGPSVHSGHSAGDPGGWQKPGPALR